MRYLVIGTTNDAAVEELKRTVTLNGYPATVVEVDGDELTGGLEREALELLEVGVDQ